MGHRQHIWAMGGSHMVNKSLMNAKKTLSQHSVILLVLLALTSLKFPRLTGARGRVLSPSLDYSLGLVLICTPQSSQKAGTRGHWGGGSFCLPAPGTGVPERMCPLAGRTHHLAEVVFAVATVLDIVHLQHFFLTQQACHLGTEERQVSRV